MSLAEMLAKTKKAKEEAKAAAETKPTTFGNLLQNSARKSNAASEMTLSLANKISEAKNKAQETLNVANAQSDLRAQLASVSLQDLATPAKQATATNTQAYQYREQAESCDDEVMAQLYENLACIADTFGRPELRDQLKATRLYLQKHPQLKDILKDEDIGIMVRGLRETYANAVNSRVANKTKRKAANAEVDNLMNDLGDMVF